MKYPISRITAIVGTILFHVLILFISFYFYVDNSTIELITEEWPPRDSSEILFGGEYVMIGDAIESSDIDDEPQEATGQDEENTQEASDLKDEGSLGDPPQIVSSTNESPMPVVTKPNQPTTPGATIDNNEPSKNKSAKAETEKTKNTNPNISFNNKSSSGNGASNGAKQGQADGTTNKPSASKGEPGYNLPGRTIAHWEPIKKRNKLGTVTLRVTVDANGNVTNAQIIKTKGAVAGDEAILTECINAAKKCRFSVSKEGKKSQKGTITYKIK